MARKAQENPQLDMTPMIDVVFELIIFFVVTLTQCNAKDETIKLEDGRHGIELTPEEMPPTQMTVDIARTGRISMGDITMTPEQIGQRVKERAPQEAIEAWNNPMFREIMREFVGQCGLTTMATLQVYRKFVTVCQQNKNAS